MLISIRGIIELKKKIPESFRLNTIQLSFSNVFFGNIESHVVLYVQLP